MSDHDDQSTTEPWATTRLDAIRKLRREGYAVVKKDRLDEVLAGVLRNDRVFRRNELGNRLFREDVVVAAERVQREGETP
jgi:galactose-1-phosphate uridylyltransferase